MLKRKCDLDLSSSLHLWWVMMSYALTPLTPVWCEVNVLSLSLSLYSFIFFLLLSFFFSLFVIIFLVIQSDLERIFKNCDENFHCKHVLIVKEYGKLGILYDEKLGGFYIKKVHPFLIRMDYVLIEK